MVRGSVAFVTTLVAGLMLLLLFPLGVRADSFTVDLLTDTGNRGYCNRPGITGHCTLREAITASNANGQWNNIYLPAGNYLLNSALPPITSSLFIQGDGPDATVIWGPCWEVDEKGSVIERPRGDGLHCDLLFKSPARSEFRVFHIASGKVGLFEMTIRGGQGPDGGGILNEGSLELHHVTVMRNLAHNGGGGISTSGSLLLANSTVRDNFSHHGPAGGILNARHVPAAGGFIIRPGGSVEVMNSTISGNQIAVGDDDYPGYGGGIMNEGLIVIQNSTISGNHATCDPDKFCGDKTMRRPNAGGIVNRGEAWLGSVTIAANYTAQNEKTSAGGVSAVGEKFYFHNTIIAGNKVGAQKAWKGRELDCLGQVVTHGGNLVGSLGGLESTPAGDRPCQMVSPTPWPTTWSPKPQSDIKDVLVQDVLVVSQQDPGDKDSFAPQLADNGGLTYTHALCTGRQPGDYDFLFDTYKYFCARKVNGRWVNSLAKDRAWRDPHSPFVCEAYDQTGAMRVDGLCDIGAVEAY